MLFLCSRPHKKAAITEYLLLSNPSYINPTLSIHLSRANERLSTKAGANIGDADCHVTVTLRSGFRTYSRHRDSLGTK